jgi:DNA-directed RNA polymerase specialized sigma24 family protein
MTPSSPPLRLPDDPAEEQALLERLHRAGAAAHALPLRPEAFAHGARLRAGWTADDDGASPLEALRAMSKRERGPDLFLVIACDAGVPGAWERLAAACLPAVARALTAQGIRPDEADVRAADLPGHLIQPPRHGRSPTRLGGYRGASSLATFLAVAALALRTSEKRIRPLVSLDALGPEGEEGQVAHPPAREQARVEDAEQAARLRDSLPGAWARLTRQESLALLFKCRDDLPQKTIALLLGVGAPRVSRLVDRAQARLRDALAPVGAGGSAASAADRAQLGHVIARFLATSFPDVRPWGAPAPQAAGRPESR